MTIDVMRPEKVPLEAIPVGSVVALEEQMGEEIRETYYLRTERGMALYGCIQGDPVAGTRDTQDPDYAAPRYKNITGAPHEYALIPKLPVRSAVHARWCRLGSALHAARKSDHAASQGRRRFL